MEHEDNILATPTCQTPPPPYHRFPDEQEAEQTNQVLVQRPLKSQLHTLSSPQVFPPANSLFPPSWNLYYTLAVGQGLALGPHERQPLYVVSMRTGWWTERPDIVLHRGLDDSARPLAAGMAGFSAGQHSVILLPPGPGSAPLWSQETLLRVGSDKPPARFRFAVKVGAGDGPDAWRREVFEWRCSRDDVVAAFLTKAKRGGWVLVRLAGRGEGGAEDRASDGEEIVAVWAYARLSITKVLKFRFVGAGATGVFGERWAIMAAMTALRMYQRQMRNGNWDW